MALGVVRDGMGIVGDVAELRIPAKPGIRQGQVHRLAAQVWPGVHDAPDAELKEVDRFPSHRHLKNAVKFVQRHDRTQIPIRSISSSDTRLRILEVRCNPRRPERVIADRRRDPGRPGAPGEHLPGAVPVEAALRERAIALE